MNAVTAMLTGTGLGCLAMYTLDPEMGRRRRAVARDKVVKIQRKAGEAATLTARDVRNRTLGTLAEGRALFGGSVDDATLVERVRAELGYLVRYPSFIHVHADDGRVFLSGSVFADEIEQLIAGIRSIRGVREVENHLQPRERIEEFPGLQGPLAPKPTGRPLDLLQHNWAPATRLLLSVTALAGIGVFAYAFSEVNGAGARGRQWKRLRSRRLWRRPRENDLWRRLQRMF